MPEIIFAINPGSTTTKTALYRRDVCLFEQSLSHSAAELAPYRTIAAQLPMRLAAIENALTAALAKAGHADTRAISAVVSRGGLLHPVVSGVYEVNEDMLADLTKARYGEHASNLGALIASVLGERFGCPAYIVDPVVVDELEPAARLTGLPEIKRRSVFHALNQKAVARQAAADLNCKYEDINLIVVHMGGGISIAAHRRGRVIDVNNALEEGPFSPERAGSLPTLPLLELAFSGQYDSAALRRKINGQGGMAALLGTNDCRMVEDLAAQRPDYALVLDAMAYQTAKWIGAMATVLKGEIKAVVLTGGMARSKYLTERIHNSVAFLAPVLIYPGEKEMAALISGVLRVLAGQEKPGEYKAEV
ncbi:MAG: butyrate kinase [Saccharofermentanales bacterium]|jgi:butyrate kinase